MSQSKLVISISVPSKLVASAMVASELVISKMSLLIWNTRFSMQCNFIQFYSRLFINMITFNMIQWKEFISSKLMHYGIFVQFRFWIKIQYLLEVTRRSVRVHFCTVRNQLTLLYAIRHCNKKLISIALRQRPFKYSKTIQLQWPLSFWRKTSDL